jgi:hypothetical protein
VKKYAGLEPCLNVRDVNIFLIVILNSHRKRLLFLPDIQKVHSEFLQLTAGDTNHSAINGWQTVIAAKPWETCKTLKIKKIKNK